MLVELEILSLVFNLHLVCKLYLGHVVTIMTSSIYPHAVRSVKGPLAGLRQVLLKNAFHFMLNTPFVLEIFTFLS